jgi:ribulose-5-phosphate 4-epimerase/fuculose-1-phosphate aldolase
MIMAEREYLKNLWHETRKRLLAKELLRNSGASLSLRCPGDRAMLYGEVVDTDPRLVYWDDVVASGIPAVHAAVYTRRPDVGAIAWGGASYGPCLDNFGGVLPQIFDEQARHLGPMTPALKYIGGLEQALRKGGNVLLMKGMPLCFGVTCTRLALNLELFEKCVKAYILAIATGGAVKPLPWWVRHIANGRLAKDQRRAAEAFKGGELPVESRAY